MIALIGEGRMNETLFFISLNNSMIYIMISNLELNTFSSLKVKGGKLNTFPYLKNVAN